MPSITIHLTDEQVLEIVDAIITNKVPQDGEHVTIAGISGVHQITNTPRDKVEDIPAQNVDQHGIPWHPEYHSSVKKLTTKGFWKRVRRGDKIATNAYEAQYATTPGNPPVEEDTNVIPMTLGGPMVVPGPPTDDIMPEALPMPIPIATPEPAPVTYEAVLQAFKEAGERIGVDEATKALGELYVEYDVNPPSQLNTDETKRAGVFEGLEAL